MAQDAIVDGKQAVLIHMPVAVHAQLKALAAKERRSMTQETILAVEAHLAKQEAA